VIERFSRRAFLSSFILLAAGPAIAFGPQGAQAQQPASPRRIGVLFGIGGSRESKIGQQFRQGLLEAGYTEGRDVIIEWRSANGDYGRIPELAADLVQRKPEVIVVTTTVAANAVTRMTSTIPVVMALVADPVGSGLVTNLAHPGGNVTGLSIMMAELGAKRLQLLKEAIPSLTRVAILWNPATPYHSKAIEGLKAVAASLGIELSFMGIRTPEDFGPAFSAAMRAQAQALYVLDAPLFFTHRTRLLEQASKTRLPGNYAYREYVDEGGLMSYGTSLGDVMRRSAGYVDKILMGARPGDLPIEQPTKFEFVVNLRTAKALGLTIPHSVLLQADDVIR
jgi:putative ABC transport system substrate-binding protein